MFCRSFNCFTIILVIACMITSMRFTIPMKMKYIPKLMHVKLYDNKGNLICDTDIDAKTGKEMPKARNVKVIWES